MFGPRTMDSAEVIVSAALVAHKDGTLPELLRQRPLLSRWIARRWLGPVLGVAGDWLDPDPSHATAVALLLRCAIHQMRPDAAGPGAPINRLAWLQQTSWRPMLAVLCHFGFCEVPDFREQYRRHPGESVAENLCGLWSVGPSSFYRYLGKGKRLATEILLADAIPGEHRISLRQLVLEHVLQDSVFDNPAARVAWHERHAAKATVRRDAVGALWHLFQIGQFEALSGVVKRFSVELADDSEAALLLNRCLLSRLTVEQHVDLLLARASLWRTSNDEERERHAYEQALQLASGQPDKFLLGVVYCALGRFYESRDTDRALAHFEDGAELLRQASTLPIGDRLPQRLAEYLAALVKMAWLCVLRNDPRSRVLLEKSDLMRDTPELPGELVAMLEQTWGEYWRRAGEFRRALEHKHRALNIYERLGDLQQVLNTYNNLSILYAEIKDFARAVGYGRRVLDMAERVPVDPYVLAGTQVNLGAALFWMEDYGGAIAQYQRALALSTSASLHVFENRAHYNLAEAFYKRFQVLGDPGDEREGDFHVAAGLKARPAETDSFLLEATLKLKTEMLGPNEGFALTRLVPEEDAAHPEEMAEVQHHRRVLAVPASPNLHIRAHLVIANAYMAIAVKEREAGLGLIDRHRPEESFNAELERIRSTYSSASSVEQSFASQWDAHAADLLSSERRAALLHHLIQDRTIQKSGFALTCGLSPATASKYLAELTRRGLLAQTGKGPSTRYRLLGAHESASANAESSVRIR